MERFAGIDKARLEEILSEVDEVRVGLLGDLCLDVYWHADMTRSELSRETPHYPLPVVSETMSPGAGGNVAANMAALRPKRVLALGIIGCDWRGASLREELERFGIDDSGIVASDGATTNAYCKPFRKGISSIEYEDPRIDFENHDCLAVDDERRLVDALDSAAAELDVLCISDQFPFGCITPRIRERIHHHASNGLCIIVDSRNHIGVFEGVILKPNGIECLRAVDCSDDSEEVPLEKLAETARALAERNRATVCMTLGARGSVYSDSRTSIHIPTAEIPPPIDFCGAGDAFLAAFACALATGARPEEAAFVADLSAGVTIRKIGTTGTATRSEILARYEEIHGVPADSGRVSP
jgi:D-glycero-beta-D-manno-heptose-7-phosphate kinase